MTLEHPTVHWLSHPYREHFRNTQSGYWMNLTGTRNTVKNRFTDGQQWNDGLEMVKMCFRNSTRMLFTKAAATDLIFIYYFCRNSEGSDTAATKKPVRRLGLQSDSLDATNAWCGGPENIYVFGKNKMAKTTEVDSLFVWTARTTLAIRDRVPVYESGAETQLLRILQEALPKNTFLAYLIMCGKVFQ